MLRTIFLAKTKCLQGILKKLVMQKQARNHIVTSHVICSKNATFNVFQPQKEKQNVALRKKSKNLICYTIRAMLFLLSISRFMDNPYYVDRRLAQTVANKGCYRKAFKMR